MDQTNDEIVSSQIDEEMARLDELDEKEQEQWKAQDAAAAAETKPDDLSPTMGRSAAKVREEEKPAVEEEPEEPEDTRVTGRESQERFFETGKEALQTAGNVLKTGNEVKNAIGAGTADWVADSLRAFGIKTQVS